MNESERRLQEHFANRIPEAAFQIVASVAKKASGDTLFKGALSMFCTVKWVEIDAISYEAMLVDTNIPESTRREVREKLRHAKTKLAQISEGRKQMMELMHPDTNKHIQSIESSFTQAYEIGSSGIHEMSRRVDLMRNIVAGFNIDSLENARHS